MGRGKEFAIQTATGNPAILRFADRELEDDNFYFRGWLKEWQGSGFTGALSFLSIGPAFRLKQFLKSI